MNRLLALALAAFIPLSVACAAQTDDGAESAEDDLVATFNSTAKIDLNKTSRILLIGDSDQLGDLPLDAATTRARRYVQLYPNDQIVMFVTSADSNQMVMSTGATIATQEPFPNLTLADMRTLTGDKLVKALSRFTRIASLDFFGHSSPFGSLVETSGDGVYFAPNITAGFAGLKKSFARDVNPYVTLNGCNGGVQVASQLSAMWQVPVSGALSASNFEVLMDDGRWYPNDVGLYPAGRKTVATNLVSFGPNAPRQCSRGACVRMKPENAPYYGVWSNQDTGFQFGLNYYKFFCAYDDPNETCAKGMAQSLYSFPSIKPISAQSSDQDFTDVLADYLCDTNKDATWFDTCKTNLLAAHASHSAFSPMKSANDYSLECDFTGCDKKFRCEVDPQTNWWKKGTCVWVDKTCPDTQKNPSACRTKNKVKQTTNNEMDRFFRGHALNRTASGG